MASIKYKDNGEYKDIVVKVGDTLPIGAIIGFDTTGTIPNGWEYYAENQIKKIAPVTPANGNIENAYGTSQENTYSQEYINKFTNYSTTEQVVGKWIDGKPLYRKVVDYQPSSTISSANTTTNISIPHNIVNFKQIVKASMVNEGGYVFPTIGSSTGSTITLSDTITKVDTTNINFRIINNSWLAIHFYIILEYTKTTD